MRYFVVADDGTKYGPADLSTLNTWISEGRLLPGTLLEEEESSARIAAAAVAGLVFPSARSAETAASTGSIFTNPPTGGQQGPHGASTARNHSPRGDVANTEVIFSWVLAGMGFCTCCCIGWLLSGIGLFLGVRAKQKGHPGGQAAAICNGIVLAISIVMSGFYFATIGSNWPQFKRQWQQAMEQQQRIQRGQPPFDSNPPRNL